MSKQECRESRAVPFDPHGVAWAAAIVSVDDGGIRESSDVDALGRLLPSPPKPLRGPKPLPFQAQGPPGFLSQPRLPLGPRGGNEVPSTESVCTVVRKVLGTEIQSLEQEKDRLKQQVALQQKIIRGFCQLQAVKDGGVH